MSQLKVDNIKLLKEKQDLQTAIQELKKKKKDMDFVVEHDKKLQAAQSAKIEIQAKYRSLLKVNSKLLSEIDLILEVDKFRPTKHILTKPKSNTTGEAIANLGTGDWHSEEEVKPEQVQGYNKFDLKICEIRVNRMFRTFLRLVGIERSAIRIDKIVVNIIGDLFSGYIHDDLAQSNLLSPAEALLFVEDLLIAGLMFLLEKGNFAEVEVVCHPGNHTRYTNGKAIHHKDRAQKTFEWILFCQLKKIFEKYLKDDRIKFIIPHSSIYINDQFGYKIRTQHGNDFNYQGGIGGETIPVNKKLLRWNRKENAYIDVFGHLHRYTTPYNYIQIGSLIGYNQLALHKGFEYEDPKQAFFLISKKRGLIVNRPIYVSDRAEEGW